MVPAPESVEPGDHHSWPARLEQARPYLLNVAARQIRPHWRGKLAASDLVQQTLAEAAAATNRMELVDGDLLRWLRRILANNVLDARRKLDAHKRALGREVTHNKSRLLRIAPSPATADPAADLLRDEQDAQLDRAIASLAPEYRRVIQLRHAEDRRFAEIAEQLGVSENAAQKLWARATEALRRAMKEQA